MIPQSGEVSLSDMLTELGQSSSKTENIENICASLNIFSTGATCSATSWFNTRGFSGANVYHFLTVHTAVINGTDVRITVRNNGSVDSFSGTLYYQIYNSGYVKLGSGSLSYTSISSQSTQYQDAAFGFGTPYFLWWRWTTALEWNETINIL